MLIYKIQNKINNKVYIGQTTRTISRRWQEHCQNAKNGNSSVIYKAIRKYGKDNFTVSMVCKANNLDELNQREINCIRLFKAISNGYNSKTGGFGGKHSAETKLKISIANKLNPSRPWLGKSIPEETKLKISNTKKLQKQAVGSKNPMYGKKHLKKSIIKNAVSNGSREFIVSKNNGIIGTWINKTECAKQLGLSREQVRDCLKGRYKTSGGYNFKYKEVISG